MTLILLAYLLVSFVGAVLIRQLFHTEAMANIASLLWFVAWPACAIGFLIDFCAQRLP